MNLITVMQSHIFSTYSGDVQNNPSKETTFPSKKLQTF